MHPLSRALRNLQESSYFLFVSQDALALACIPYIHIRKTERASTESQKKGRLVRFSTEKYGPWARKNELWRLSTTISVFIDRGHKECIVFQHSSEAIPNHQAHALSLPGNLEGIEKSSPRLFWFIPSQRRPTMRKRQFCSGDMNYQDRENVQQPILDDIALNWAKLETKSVQDEIDS